MVEQWQGEMRQKFHLHLDIITRGLLERYPRGNPFDERDLMIARLGPQLRLRIVSGYLNGSRAGPAGY